MIILTPLAEKRVSSWQPCQPGPSGTGSEWEGNGRNGNGGLPYRRGRDEDEDDHEDDDDHDHDACDERARVTVLMMTMKSASQRDGGVKGLLHRIRSKFFGHSALSLSVACMACLLGSGSIRFATLM